MASNMKTYPSNKASMPPTSHLTRPTDHDFYPTRPRAELQNLTTLLALGDPLAEDCSHPELRQARDHGTDETEKRHEVEVDSGYSSRNREEVSIPSRRGGRIDISPGRSFAYDRQNGAAREAHAWWRMNNDDGRSLFMDDEDAEQERDLYDDQGFLIESTEDLASFSSSERGEESRNLAPRARECFPTLLFGASSSKDSTSRTSKHHILPSSSPRNFHTPTASSGIGYQQLKRTDSRFSFTASSSDELLVTKREVVDAEKQRRWRQQLSGLEGCELTAQEEEERRELLSEKGFVHKMGTSTVAWAGDRYAEGGVGRGHCLGTLERRVGSSITPLGREPTDCYGGAEGDVPVGYCAQCSAVHVGRRADALDSVIEGFGFESGRRMVQFGDVKGEVVTMGERELTGMESWRRKCWLSRWLGCVADDGCGKVEDRTDRRKGTLWDCKPKAERRKLCKPPPGAKKVTGR